MANTLYVYRKIFYVTDVLDQNNIIQLILQRKYIKEIN